jgi:hypothetical protein
MTHREDVFVKININTQNPFKHTESSYNQKYKKYNTKQKYYALEQQQ